MISTVVRAREWSRIKTGKTIPIPDYVDLSTNANSVLGFLKPQAAESEPGKGSLFKFTLPRQIQ